MRWIKFWNKKYIYHYSAEINKQSKIDTWDGIIQRREPIKTMEDYRNLKRDMLNHFTDSSHTDALVIKSLTML